MLQDVRFAVRLLGRDRTFTVTAVLTLAICIGANTAMFSIVRSVLMKPLPFADSERIVLLYNSYPNAGANRAGAGVPDYYDRLTAVPALDRQALFRREGMTFGDEAGAERLNSLRTTPSFFQMVGLQTAAGRPFTDQEGKPGKNDKVILSFGFWHRKFNLDRSVIGRTIRLNGTPFEVVGVAPQAFTFLQNDIDVYVPAAFGPDDKSDQRRHSNNWQMVGRLKPGATIDQVRQQVDALNAANDERFPQFKQILRDARFHTVAVFLQDDLVRDVKAALYLLWGGVFFVLVIGCVNIANLVVVRASARKREMATRHAIGGDLGRLARQLLTETTILSIAGGTLGILAGWWALQSVTALNLNQLPRGYEIGLDPVTVVLIALLTVIVGVLLGAAPALRLRRMNLNAELREESRGGTASRAARWTRTGLAIGQVALALLLLVGAGLLLASFRAVMRLDFGFQSSHVETATVSLPAASYKDPPALVAFEQRALASIRALPGIRSAGATSIVPFSGSLDNNVMLAEGYVMKPGESLIAPTTVVVTSGYFEAMGVRLLRGRFFDQRDTAEAPRTVVIDDRLAQRFWPDRDAIGRRLYRPDSAEDLTKVTPNTAFFTVVGVIKEMRIVDPRTDFTPVGATYFPYEQSPGRNLALIVKTDGEPAAVVESIRRAVAGIDPQLPVYRPRSMEEWVDLALAGRRVPMLIAMAFGVVALLLAAIGIYGVLAYGVAERRRELGVRMALGGTAANVFGLVLRDGVTIVGIGLMIGLILSFVLTPLMKALLFNVAAINPVVLLLVTLALAAVAIVASVVPAWRASKIDPILVLSR
jgi:predicted permease